MAWWRSERWRGGGRSFFLGGGVAQFALSWAGGAAQARGATMKSDRMIRNYYVLPCCLLLLNLCVEMVSYKARLIDDVLLRTAAIMGMVLIGTSLVTLLVAPAIVMFIGALHRGSRQTWGGLGEMGFLLLLGLVIFWLYYRVYIIGPESVLPWEWRNHVKR